MANGHATYSPSGALRWLACPASVAMEEGLPDKSGPDSRYGSAAHELAAMCLERDETDPADEFRPPAAYLGRKLGDGYDAVEVDEEMVEGVAAYLELVHQYADGNPILVEQALPIGHITGEEGATGTGDVIIMRGDELIVIDLKFGRGVEVEATDNPQLKLYGLGALERFDMLGDFKRFRGVIIQPRISSKPKEWSCSIEELRAEAQKFTDGAAVARLAMKFKDNWKDDAANGYYNPSDKACMFCKFKPQCPALKLFVQRTVGADFEDLTIAASNDLVPQLVAGITDLGTAMSAVDMIEGWCRAVRAEVERKLTTGETVSGYKLVQGKRGNRQWGDEAAVEDLVRKKFRLTIEEACNVKLKSPPQLEKVLKDQPKRWQQLEPLITQSEGKLSVAHETDARPAITPAAVADDFQDEEPIA